MAKDKEGFSNAVRLAREHDLGVDARDLLEEYADYLYEHMEFEMAMEKYLQVPCTVFISPCQLITSWLDSSIHKMKRFCCSLSVKSFNYQIFLPNKLVSGICN